MLCVHYFLVQRKKLFQRPNINLHKYLRRSYQEMSRYNIVKSILDSFGGSMKQEVKHDRRVIGLSKTRWGSRFNSYVSIAGGIKYRSTVFARFSPRLIPLWLPRIHPRRCY